MATLPAPLRRRVPRMDYLSNLPDSLLLHILSFLSTHNSVRTSVLARRWRNLWASVPAIRFDYEDFHPEAVSRADEIVQQFIASRINSSAVFSLSIVLDHPCPVSWIDYAKSHGARAVTLYLNYFPLQTPIFSTLFDWPSLLTLDLQFGVDWPRVDIPPECIALSNLKNLFLTVGVFSVESMRRLLACCPNLEILFLDLSESYDAAIEIAVPNLRKLGLTGTLSKTRINCPNLESLCIDSSSYLEDFHLYAPSLVRVHLVQFRWCHTLASSLCNVAELAISLVILPADLVEAKPMIESFKSFHKIKKLSVDLHHLDFTMQLLILFLLGTPNLRLLHLMDAKDEKESFSSFSHGAKYDDQSESLKIMPSESFNNLKLILVQIKYESARSTFLEMLFERVRAWGKVVVKCI